MFIYLSILLFTGLAWGQDSLDKLILKNGVEYLGKFQKEENGLIYFRPEEGYNYQPIEQIKVDTLIIAEELTNNEEKFNNDRYRKHNLSLGLFNEYTGLSVMGYNYNIRLSEMSEIFFGGGTSILVTSLSAGIKVYGKKSKLSYYTTLSMDQSVFFVVFRFLNIFMPSFSAGLEYNYSEYGQIKFGGMGKILVGESSSFILPVPFLSANFKFWL